MGKKDFTNQDFKNLIDKFEPLVYKITGKYTAGFPDKKDDIIGSAMLGLCEGINQSVNKKIENVAGCIYINVHKEIIDFLIKDRVIQLPRSYIRKMKMLAYEQGKEDEFSVQDLFPKLFSIAAYNWQDWRLATDEYRWFDVLDTMDWLELDDFERRVVWGKMQGYTYRELADILDCSVNWPNLIIKEVRKRWKKKDPTVRGRFTTKS